MNEFRIRSRLAADDAALVSIENRAGRQFADHGHPEIAGDGFASVAQFRDILGGYAIRVAVGPGDAPVGFAAAGRLGDFMHLREISVDPAHGRRGVGTALVMDIVRMATDAGLSGVSLTTFRLVPFNAPFYARLGFAEADLATASRELREAFDAELPPGVPAAERVLMIRQIAPY